MKLGIFDSGVGGLSVLKSIYEAKIFKHIIYYGDTARVPYGTKDKESIIKFSLEAVDFFQPHQIDMIIVACNTASAYAINEMQKKTTIPIIGVIEAGILATQNKLPDKNSKILVLATKATIHSKEYQKRLQKIGYKNIYTIAPSLFVPLVEENIFKGEILEATMKHYFQKVDFTPDGIILGCTHFPLISHSISSYFHHQSLLIHSGEAILEYIKNKLPFKIYQNTQISFYASDNVNQLKNTAKEWLKIKPDCK